MIGIRTAAVICALAFATAAGPAMAQISGMPAPTLPKAPATPSAGQQKMNNAKTPPGLKVPKQLVFTWNPDSSACGGLDRKEGQKPPAWLAADHKKAAEEIYTRRGDLNALCLFDGATLMSTVDVERAGVLYNMARIRSRFDTMRCKSQPKEYPVIVMMREKAPPPPIAAKSKTDKTANKRWVDKALAEPKLFKEESAVDEACADGGGPGPKANWAVAEKDLRDNWSKAK